MSTHTTFPAVSTRKFGRPQVDSLRYFLFNLGGPAPAPTRAVNRRRRWAPSPYHTLCLPSCQPASLLTGLSLSPPRLSLSRSLSLALFCLLTLCVCPRARVSEAPARGLHVSTRSDDHARDAALLLARGGGGHCCARLPVGAAGLRLPG